MFRPIKINPKIFIDILIVMISATLILWSLVIRPTLHVNGQVISSVFSISYIFLDIFLLLVILILLLNQNKKPLITALAFFSLAMFSQIFADVFYAYFDLSSLMVYDWSSSFLYKLSSIFTALAALSCLKNIELNLEPFLSHYRSLKKSKNWITYFPLILVIFVYGLIIYIEDPNDELLWGVGAIVILVVLRQFISINDIKKAQKSLKENKNLILRREEQLKFITSNMLDFIAESDENGNLKYVSESVYWLLGYTPQELIGQKLIDHIHVDDKINYLKAMNRAMENKSAGRIKYRIKNKNGTYLWLETIGKPVFSNKQFHSFICSSRDINQQEYAKEALKKSENKYRTIFENTGTLTLILDDNLNIKMVNEEFERFSGYSKLDIESKLNFKDFIDENNPESKEGCLKLKKNFNNKVLKNYEIGLIDRYGTKKYFVFTAESIPDTNKTLISLIDISDRKKSEKIIQDSLIEKEMMLKEIHHRVKNNLQIISSLLNLQSESVSNKEDLNLFIESKNRVKSMAMIHENLYQSGNLSKINFKEYLCYLSEQLLVSYALNNRVKLNFDCKDVFLSIETAVPCGLLVNELITNSMKHAFPNDRAGNINIALNNFGQEYELIIEDDGIGMPENINFKEYNSLGLKIINNLVNQIEGTIELNNDVGT